MIPDFPDKHDLLIKINAIFIRKKEMKNAIVLFTVLLILWIAGCAYCYVCNIRDNCREASETTVSDMTEPEKDTLSATLVKTEIPQMLSLYFAFNISTASLSGEDKRRIEEFKAYISENPGSMVIVTGHSDHAGAQRAKLKISSARAEFAHQQLMAAGIDASRISFSGKSDNEPATDESTPEGNAKNRRAEIQIK
jgi:outer membrane protein OmpA-like peptidoglycan-associated protein